MGASPGAWHFFRNDVQKVPVSYVFRHISIYCLSTLPFGYEMYKVGLFTSSILNTHGPGMGKSWVSALEPGIFFRNDVQKVPISYIFLHISIYCLSALPFGYEMCELGLFTSSILNTHRPGMGKKWVPALQPGTF